MNPIRRAILERRPALGGWLCIPNFLVVEAVAAAGFKWAALDGQHGGYTLDNVGPLLQALHAGGTAALYRVSWAADAEIMRVLDLGAIGIIVPMVNTAEDAKRVASAARYPPDGTRSFGPIRARYSTPAEANEDIVVLVMIETAAALENVDAIASTPGIDGLFVGPVDLSLSLGLTRNDGHTGHPVLFEAFRKIITAASRHGKFAGSVAFSAQHLRDHLATGFSVVSVNSDRGYIAQGARADVALIESLSEGDSGTPGPSST